MNRRNEGEVVLLVVEPSYVEEAIARRDPQLHAVLPIGFTTVDTTYLLTTMGARHGEFDLSDSRYGNVCVVAPAHRQADLIAFVAATVWPVVEAEWLHACEPPYESARVRRVSAVEAQAALDAGSATRL